jgi:glycerophosphoryl diester phosphodiesterase
MWLMTMKYLSSNHEQSVIRRTVVLLFFVAWSFAAPAQKTIEAIRRNFLDPTSGTVMVASHRAAHARHPENSLKAIQEAINLGVDIIEIDVKVSKDGIPFLMHDQTMDRTTNGKGDPEQLTWAELQKFFIVDKGRRTSLKMPTLLEALQLAQGKIMVDLDLKTSRIDAVIDVVKKTSTEEIVFFFDSDYEVLAQVQKAGKDLMIMPRAHSLSEADSAITLFDPPVVHIDFSFYTPECTDLIRTSRARVWINALGDLDEDLRKGREKRALKKLLNDGANIVQTDEPELLLRLLMEKGYR